MDIVFGTSEDRLEEFRESPHGIAVPVLQLPASAKDFPVFELGNGAPKALPFFAFQLISSAIKVGFRRESLFFPVQQGIWLQRLVRQDCVHHQSFLTNWRS